MTKIESGLSYVKQRPLTFDLAEIWELRGLTADFIDAGLVEHSAKSLGIMREMYDRGEKGGHTQADFIERNLAHTRLHRPRLHAETLASVMAVIRMSGPNSLLDIGCGEGLLLRAAAHEANVKRIVGIEAEELALEVARELVDADGAAVSAKVELCKQYVGNDDFSQLTHFGAITLIEVIEHVADKSWVREVLKLEPRMLIVTTPNHEFNTLFPPDRLQPNSFRHPGHVFEFSRQEFMDWASEAGRQHGYTTSFLPIGPADIIHGSSGQMAIFQAIT